MGMIQITGQVIRSSGQATNDLLKASVQHSKGQSQLRQIKLDQKEEQLSHLQHRNQMETIQQLQEKTREVEELKSQLHRAEHKSEVLRDLAADIVVDRATIMRTLSFLKKKWVTPEHEKEFESDFERVQKEEEVKFNQDEERQNKAYKLVDDVAGSWANPTSTRRRRQPKAKSPSPK